MIRKLLLFVALFVGGSYLLFYLTTGPVWKKTLEDEEARVTPTPPPGAGVTFESKTKGQGNKPQPRYSGTGALKLTGRPVTYDVGGGQQLDLPTYELTAKNHRIRNKGIYDLDDVLIRFLRPMRKGGKVVRGSPVSITASSMRVTIETEGEVQRLDQSKEMDFFNVVVQARLDKMEKGTILDEQESETLKLVSAHLSGYFRDEILEISTKDEEGEPKERVTVTMNTERGVLSLTGLGVRGSILTGEMAKREFSEILLLENIEIEGTGEFDVSITGKGPLMVKGGSELPWFLQLETDVKISVNQTSLGANQLIEGQGDRVRVWVGFTDMTASGATRPGRSVSDVSIQGRPAKLLVNSQLVESRQMHVAVNARGELERMATEGLTRLWLRDENGNALGKFRGRDGILWTREGTQAGQVLTGMGIDFFGSALSLVDPLWPEEVIQILGPAAYESEGDIEGLAEGVEKATAEQGLLIYAAWRYGSLIPFMIQGLGDVRIRGRIEREGTLIARGNRGFTLMHEMSSGVIHGAMGVVGGEDGYRFHMQMERSAADPDDEEGRLVDVVEGRGWIRFSSNQVKARNGGTGTALKVEFHAALQEELAWNRTKSGQKTDIHGIKSARYRQDGDGGYGLHLEGIPLIVTATEANIRATAEFCDKVTGEPWSLRGQIKPVDFYVDQAKKGSEAHLRANEVRFRRIPLLDPDVDAPMLLPIQAMGKVRLEVDFPEEGGKRRRLELDCNEFRYLPIVAAPALESIVSGMLGLGDSTLAERLLGNRGGLARALGSVTLQLTEVGGERGRDLRRMFGEDLVFEADTFSSRILPKPGGLVRVEIEEERRERLWARAEVARTRGSDIELGNKGGGRVAIWLQDPVNLDEVFHLSSAAPAIYHSGATRALVTPEDCGEAPGVSRYKGLYGIVEFPGPVLGKQLNTTMATRFEVSCRDRLVLQLRTGERAIEQGRGKRSRKWLLPQGFDRLLASGQVRLLYHEIEARGDRLGLAGESGWFRLSSLGKRPVLLGFADEYHAKYHPGIAYNLRTGEENAGRFLIKSGPMPREGVDR